MMKKSEFNEWFEEQHGKRPHTGTDDSQLLSKIQAGEIAATMLRETREWDMKFQSSLYAWQAARSNAEVSRDER